jgi:hypothetical protein
MDLSEDRNQPPEIPADALKFPDEEASDRYGVSVWVFVGLIVVLLAILIGLIAWYYVLQQPTTPTPLPTPERPSAAENNEPESSTAEASAAANRTTSPSTALDAIETDLTGTNFVDLEPLFADIEAMIE